MQFLVVPAVFFLFVGGRALTGLLDILFVASAFTASFDTVFLYWKAVNKAPQMF